MKKNILLHEVGSKIRSIREERGVSLQELSDKVDIEYNNLIRLEKGRTNPTIWTLYKISQALEINISDIVGLKQDSSE